MNSSAATGANPALGKREGERISAPKQAHLAGIIWNDLVGLPVLALTGMKTIKGNQTERGGRVKVATILAATGSVKKAGIGAATGS